jgi:hypothetical protein
MATNSHITVNATNKSTNAIFARVVMGHVMRRACQLGCFEFCIVTREARVTFVVVLRSETPERPKLQLDLWWHCRWRVRRPICRGGRPNEFRVLVEIAHGATEELFFWFAVSSRGSMVVERELGRGAHVPRVRVRNLLGRMVAPPMAPIPPLKIGPFVAVSQSRHLGQSNHLLRQNIIQSHRPYFVALFPPVDPRMPPTHRSTMRRQSLRLFERSPMRLLILQLYRHYQKRRRN